MPLSTHWSCRHWDKFPSYKSEIINSYKIYIVVGFGFTGGGGGWRRCTLVSPGEFLIGGELLGCDDDVDGIVLRGFGWGELVGKGMVVLWRGDPLKNSNKKITFSSTNLQNFDAGKWVCLKFPKKIFWCKENSHVGGMELITKLMWPNLGNFQD